MASETALDVAVLGAGRMGREILAAMAAAPGRFRLSGLWLRPGHADEGRPLGELAGGPAAAGVASADLATALAGAGVAIDFTLAGTTADICRAAVDARVPLVCGVSGLAAAELAALDAAARHIPVLYARNMSIGIAVLARAVEQAARVLGEDYPAEISDLHHAAKRDAPSGTALALGEALAVGRGREFADVRCYDEASGRGQRRAAGDIVFEVRREGSHPGAHTVRFAGAAETVSFGHEVRERRVFADGALRAARWLARQAAGRYGMDDLLVAA